MRLSIIIVNYNVRYFLEQCLKSVFTALQNIEAEVFVVDNHSVDGSVEMVQEKFKQVKLIVNKDNPGFAKANNQAMRLAQGEYILLLNPDTVVQENTFNTSLNFMDARSTAGALGIKMIDGKGHYLPESKRGLPTPWVAFYKIFGLTRFFPRSKKFARYYLGHLSENKNQEIEILAGAYMLLRKTALDKVGLLDEDYFMYGEDIDLSYRITQGGFKNYYLADSSIIHYKGESTKKGSLNYVFVFYKAMVIFAQKHFSARYASLFSLLINFAIYLRAAISVLNRLFKQIAAPLFDAAWLAAGLFYIKDYWEDNHRFIQGGEYPSELVLIAFPAYILLWLLGLFLSGGYDKPTKASQIFKGVLYGSIAILVGYSLLPESLRFSRAIIILGAFWAALILPFWRFAFQRFFKLPLFNSTNENKRVLVVGDVKELERVKRLMADSGAPNIFTGFVNTNAKPAPNSLGTLNNLPELCRVFSFTELIFCGANLSATEIFEQMERLKNQNLEIKIAPNQCNFIIGSNSINTQGNWYVAQFNGISTAANKRGKRLLDLGTALLALFLSPVLALLQKKPGTFLKNSLLVLSGKKSWVGYHPQKQGENLPKLKPGVLKTSANLSTQTLNCAAIEKLNLLYAKNYRLKLDVALLLKHWRKLGS